VSRCRSGHTWSTRDTDIVTGHDRTRRVRLEVVGEIPGAQASGLKPDEGVVVTLVCVRSALLAAEVPDGNVADDIGVRATEFYVAFDLDAAIRRLVLEDDDARPRVLAQVTHLHVVSARHDVEAAVSPSMPHGREEYVALIAVGGEDGNERKREQSVEIVRA
jgi:hypothetical protein